MSTSRSNFIGAAGLAAAAVAQRQASRAAAATAAARGFDGRLRVADGTELVVRDLK
jgi:hypothetical protein